MIEVSVYERIKANITADGKLPDTFSLDKIHEPNQLGFAPGAMDGIGLYHTDDVDEKQSAKNIANVLKRYINTGNKKYINEIIDILSDNRAISLIDSILQIFSSDNKGIDPNEMVKKTLKLIKTSSNVEIVKIGIGLLRLVDLGYYKEAEEIFTTLALYEDLTLYAVVAASNWTHGNRIIFRIAKTVDGWGKVHAVEQLKPETAEISEWILRNGCSNGVLDNYLGLTCAEKGDLISVLRQQSMDADMFNSIAIIINALLDEGPVDGISKYKHANEALLHFLRHAETHADCVEHIWRISQVRHWAQNTNEEYVDGVIEQCNVIINYPVWKEKILAAINKHTESYEFYCACNAAAHLKIDISKQLFNIVMEEPLEFYSYMPQLLKNKEMATKIINLCESVLPLDEMAEGMGDYLFPDKLHHEHHCLDFVLPVLAQYPLQGVGLIKTGLNSRVVRGRNMACRALSGWVKKMCEPLEIISPELYSEIDRIYQFEVDEHTKETMRKLLDGGYEEIPCFTMNE